MPTTPSKSGTLPRPVLGELSPNRKLSLWRTGKIQATNGEDTKSLHQTGGLVSSQIVPDSQGWHWRGGRRKRTFDELVEGSPDRKVRTLREASPTSSMEWTADERVQTAVTPEMSLPAQIDGALEAEAPAATSQRSFASLIDYDQAESQDACAVDEAAPPPETNGSNEMDIRSQAETLRLRLRVALFKVRTNQTRVPMSDLQITAPSAARPPSSANPTVTLPLPTAEPRRTTHLPAAKLLPAPILLPTPSSSSFRLAPLAPMSLSPLPTPRPPPSLPSSPPASLHTSSTSSNPTTPAQPSSSTHTRGHIVELSSPPDSAASSRTAVKDSSGREDVEREREREKAREGELSSSVVKGRAAARGLVELMYLA